MHSQTLNGAWRLIEQNNGPVNHEVIKLFSNSYFTSASYYKNSGEFIEAQGGIYVLDMLSYKEHVQIDSKEPEHSGTTIEYKATLKEDRLTLTNLHTGVTELWQKFDDANNYEMSFCWRIHQKKDESEGDWRTIEYAPRKTLKMLTNSRYQVLALNSETGKFVGSSGGTWTKKGDAYTENIEFFSKDKKNAGRTLKFIRSYEKGIWLHTGKETRGGLMMEKWVRYK